VIATPSTREEKHFQMDLEEVTLHWTEVGEGLPVLLLHGLSDSHRTWREIWPRLPGRRVLMLDLPGHGMSSRPDAPYTLDWNATQVARFIEQLDLRNLDSGPRADQTRAFRVQCRREIARCSEGRGGPALARKSSRPEGDGFAWPRRVKARRGRGEAVRRRRAPATSAP